MHLKISSCISECQLTTNRVLPIIKCDQLSSSNGSTPAMTKLARKRLMTFRVSRSWSPTESPCLRKGMWKMHVILKITHCNVNVRASTLPDVFHQRVLNKTSHAQTCCSLVSEWAPHWHGWSWDTELHSRGRGRWQLEGERLHVTPMIYLIYSIWGKHSGLSSLHSQRAWKLRLYRDTEGGKCVTLVNLFGQFTIQNTGTRGGSGYSDINLSQEVLEMLWKFKI